MVLIAAQKPTEKQFKWGDQWCTVVDYVPDKPRRTAWHRAYDRYFERTPSDPRDFNQDQEMDDNYDDVFGSEDEGDNDEPQEATFREQQQHDYEQWLAEIAQEEKEQHDVGNPKVAQNVVSCHCRVQQCISLAPSKEECACQRRQYRQ